MTKSLQTSEFRVGDNVTVGDSIRMGDFVYFERTGPHDVTVHRLPDKATAITPVYRAEKSPEQGSVRFVLVEQP